MTASWATTGVIPEMSTGTPDAGRRMHHVSGGRLPMNKATVYVHPDGEIAEASVATSGSVVNVPWAEMG